MLRLAQPSELQEIIAMKASCIRAMLEVGIDQWDEIYPSESMVSDDIANGHVYTFREDILIGSITINSILTEEYAHIPWEYTDVPILVFHRLMVHPEHQGKGHARRIMNEAEALAIARSATAVRLSAYQHNPTSLRLYESMGYSAVGEVEFRKGIFICFEKKL